MSPINHCYRLFGLILTSDLECPELPPANHANDIDIRITLGNVPSTLENPVRVHRHVQIGPGVYQFQIKGVARYRVTQGREIRVEPLPGATDGDVRLWLLGTAMGAALHQLGRVPLHVSAVVVNGKTHAFCGESGAGKSTLAAALYRRGLPMLCDDVGLAIPDGQGDVLFYPGFPRIKLWQDTLDHLGIDNRSLIRDLVRAEKYHLTLLDAFHDHPLPLGRLYELVRAGAKDQTRIDVCHRHEAIRLLLEHTYRPGMVRSIGNAQTHLRQCGEIASAIQVYRYTRPWSLAQMDDSLDQLLDHLHKEAE